MLIGYRKRVRADGPREIADEGVARLLNHYGVATDGHGTAQTGRHRLSAGGARRDLERPGHGVVAVQHDRQAPSLCQHVDEPLAVRRHLKRGSHVAAGEYTVGIRIWGTRIGSTAPDNGHEGKYAGEKTSVRITRDRHIYNLHAWRQPPLPPPRAAPLLRRATSG